MAGQAPRVAWAWRAALLVAVLAVLAAPARGADASAWASRTIYQVLTDRAALPGAPAAPACDNLSTWCGGTLSGLAALLPYIRGMGFDALCVPDLAPPPLAPRADERIL